MKKIVLREDEMPTRWYNVVPDIPGGLLPPLDPQTHQPISPEKLAAVFPMGLLEQEMSQERFIDIVNPLLGELERFVTAQNQPQSDAVRKKLLAAGYPDATHSLSQAALAVLKSLPGLGCSLVGMRRPEYVADVMSAVDFPTVDGVSILRRFGAE